MCLAAGVEGFIAPNVAGDVGVFAAEWCSKELPECARLGLCPRDVLFCVRFMKGIVKI